MRRSRAVLALPLLSLLISGCSGSDSGGDGGGGVDADPQELVATAQESFAGAGTVAVKLTSDGVPKDANGVTAAKGDGVIDATTPKFQGTITGTVNGVTGELQIIAIGEQTWLKFFTPDYNPIDMSTLGAPNPAMLFHPESGLPGLIGKTTDLKAGEQKRAGSEVLSEVSGKLPGSEIQTLLALGDGTGEFDVTYGVTDDGELRTAVLTGPFYTDAEASYTFEVSDYGKSVEISEP